MDKKLFTHLLSKPSTVAAFLRCLSEIETAGATWIVAAPAEFWTTDLHQHALDELRHAKRLGDLVRKFRVDGPAKVQADLEDRWCRATASYLKQLLSSAYRRVPKDATPAEHMLYLYAGLALAVERRLMKIYPTLAKQAHQPEVRELATQLIAEEKTHLSLVTRTIKTNGFEKHAEVIVEIEERLAQKWFEILTRSPETEAKNEIKFSTSFSGTRLPVLSF